METATSSALNELMLDGQPTGVHALVTNEHVVLFRDGDAIVYDQKARQSGTGGSVSDGSLRAPMPGKVVAAPVEAGDAVAKGQTVVVLEAMKMEHALTAPFDGVVESVAAVGDQVTEAAVLAVVKADA